MVYHQQTDLYLWTKKSVYSGVFRIFGSTSNCSIETTTSSDSSVKKVMTHSHRASILHPRILERFAREPACVLLRHFRLCSYIWIERNDTREALTNSLWDKPQFCWSVCRHVGFFDVFIGSLNKHWNVCCMQDRVHWTKPGERNIRERFCCNPLVIRKYPACPESGWMVFMPDRFMFRSRPIPPWKNRISQFLRRSGLQIFIGLFEQFPVKHGQVLIIGKHFSHWSLPLCRNDLRDPALTSLLYGMGFFSSFFTLPWSAFLWKKTFIATNSNQNK